MPNKVVLIFPLTEEEQYEDIERSSTRSRSTQNEATFANEWILIISLTYRVKPLIELAMY